MHTPITSEIYIFSLSLIIGIFFGLLFDFSAVLKRQGINPYICDFSLWVIFFIILWSWLIFITNGLLRAYEFCGSILGYIMYRNTVGTLSKYVLLFIYKIFLKIFKLIFKILLTPRRFLYKILLYTILKYDKKI